MGQTASCCNGTQDQNAWTASDAVKIQTQNAPVTKGTLPRQGSQVKSGAYNASEAQNLVSEILKNKDSVTVEKKSIVTLGDTVKPERSKLSMDMYKAGDGFTGPQHSAMNLSRKEDEQQQVLHAPKLSINSGAPPMSSLPNKNNKSTESPISVAAGGRTAAQAKNQVQIDPLTTAKVEQMVSEFHQLVQSAAHGTGKKPKLVDQDWMESFQILNLLRQEIFSELFLIRMVQSNGSAMPRVLRRIKKILFKDPMQGIRDFRHSLEELLALEHPNMTQLLDYREDMHSFFLIFETCNGANLFDEMDQAPQMTENMAAEITRQILSTMVYLHSKGFVYGNLNPQVLMLDDGGNIQDSLNLKLVDIDLQSAIACSGHPLFATPLYFQSPEVIDQYKITDKQDVWATGILLSIMLTGEPPHQNKVNSQLLVRAVIDGTTNFEYDSLEWKETSQNAVEFVRKLLEPDSQKRTKAVTALNDRWLLNITKARKQNQIKVLSQQVCNTFKSFMSELRFYQSLSDLIQIVTISQDEGKLLTYLFRQKDQTGEGFLKMDDIREVYQDYSGGLVEPSVIDANLSKCTISISKRGQIRYREFIEVLAKKQLDAQKQRVRKCFNQYDEKRLSNNKLRYDYVKPALLYKTEVKKMIGAIAKSNNNQSENYLNDHDKDQDDYLTIDEAMGLVIMLATAQSS